MSASKDKQRGTWKVYIRYIDWQGVKQIHTKRGFPTKREALEYEREFLSSKSRDLNMSFESFVDIYLNDLKPRIKYNTYLTKVHIIEGKILPYFSRKSISEITAPDILQWQNELLKKSDQDGRAYSQTYLRTIQNQFNAILNHANKYYGLTSNPAHKTTKMGKSKAQEMLFWTKDEYICFSEKIRDKPQSFYAFEILYWCGIREGELLALSKDDFNFEKKTLSISKSFQRLKGEDYITSPKTEKSNRVIQLPQFLCDEIKDYLDMFYHLDSKARIFNFTKSYLHHEMSRGCDLSGVKRIRIHDLRHSHVAYLIEQGFSPVVIADRLGHESISITLNYAHLYPSKQLEIADMIEKERVNNV